MRSAVVTNLMVLLASAWRRRYLITVPILVMPFVGLAAGLLAPKHYQSYTTILIQEAARQNPFLEDLAIATNLGKRMKAMDSLLHSQHVLNEVALEMGYIDSDSSAQERQFHIARLSSALRASLIGEELIHLSYTADNPLGMKRVLELVSNHFIDRVVSPQRSSIVSSEQFLKKELGSRRVDLEAAEERLAAYKSRYAEQLPELHTTNVNRLETLRQNLDDRRIKLGGARAARDSTRSKLQQTNPVVGRMEELIVQTLGELAELRTRYTDQHTLVQAVLRRITSLEDERARILRATPATATADLDRLWNLASSQRLTSPSGAQPLLISQLQKLQEAETRITELAQEVATLEREMGLLSERVSGYGEHELQLKQLERDLTVKQKIYQNLSERYQNARVTGALGRWEENERVKIIDAPFTPVIPATLPLFYYIIAGLFGGIGLGLGLAVIAELADTSIRLRSTLEQLLGVPVLTRIEPLAGSHPKPGPEPLSPSLPRMTHRPGETA